MSGILEKRICIRTRTVRSGIDKAWSIFCLVSSHIGQPWHHSWKLEQPLIVHQPSVCEFLSYIRCSAKWVDLKYILNHNPTPIKAQFHPLFNVNFSQLQLNSTSAQFQLNFHSISSQPQIKINLSLNSTATITSTQYGCDIKATQSCSIHFFSSNDFCQAQPNLSWLAEFGTAKPLHV